MTDTENILQTLKTSIQDVLTPDVRELKIRAQSLEKQVDTKFNAVETQFHLLRAQQETQFNALRDQQDANFKAVMAAIGESKAKQDLETYKLIAALSERVVALEAARH